VIDGGAEPRGVGARQDARVGERRQGDGAASCGHRRRNREGRKAAGKRSEGRDTGEGPKIECPSGGADNGENDAGHSGSRGSSRASRPRAAGGGVQTPRIRRSRHRQRRNEPNCGGKLKSGAFQIVDLRMNNLPAMDRLAMDRSGARQPDTAV
jgi:hypothetical protein